MDAKERRQFVVALRLVAPWALAAVVVLWLHESAFEAVGIGRRWHDALSGSVGNDLYLDVMTRLGEMASFDAVEAEFKRSRVSECALRRRRHCTG